MCSEVVKLLTTSPSPPSFEISTGAVSSGAPLWSTWTIRVAERASGVLVVGVEGAGVCFFFTHFPFFPAYPFLHFLVLLCFLALAFVVLACP